MTTITTYTDLDMLKDEKFESIEKIILFKDNSHDGVLYSGDINKILSCKNLKTLKLYNLKSSYEQTKKLCENNFINYMWCEIKVFDYIDSYVRIDRDIKNNINIFSICVRWNTILNNLPNNIDTLDIRFFDSNSILSNLPSSITNIYVRQTYIWSELNYKKIFAKKPFNCKIYVVFDDTNDVNISQININIYNVSKKYIKEIFI